MVVKRGSTVVHAHDDARTDWLVGDECTVLSEMEEESFGKFSYQAIIKDGTCPREFTKAEPHMMTTNQMYSVCMCIGGSFLSNLSSFVFVIHVSFLSESQVFLYDLSYKGKSTP